MEPRISIIVPVYNTKKYLDRCVRSLLSQSMKGIRIILVDDGSTDGSAEVCDAFAAEDKRVLVIHKEHEGVAAARNTGVEAVRSCYLMFVDSDDWVVPEYCERPYEIAKKNGADMVMFGRSIDRNGHLKELKSAEPEGIVSKARAMALIDHPAVGTSLWNKLYKKKLFDNVRFPAGRVHEDIAAIYKLVYNASTVYYLPVSLYNYTSDRIDSITNTKDIRNLTDRYDMYFQRAQDLLSWGYDYNEYLARLQLAYLVQMGRQQEHSDECDQAVLQIKGYPKLFTLRQNIVLTLYRFSPFLFDVVCKVTGRRDL